MENVSNGFMSFMQEAGAAGQAYMALVTKLSESSALGRKEDELAYIAVLSATRMSGGIPFHVKSAKKLGASRDEVKSAVLVGLPAVGLMVLDALPVALQSYDEA
jgi:alkylhydroperoxidase/carboxymuconolactone decarboxylase family protein YurZ